MSKLGKKENKVIVYGWHSALQGGHSVGHVAIEIPSRNIYVSFCPKTGDKHELATGIFKSINGYFHNNFEEDKKCEEREPEFVRCLYWLDIDEIVKYFEEIEPKVKEAGWSFLAGHYKTNAECCTTAAHRLLLKGDEAGYIKKNSFSEFSSSILPDRFIQAIEDAALIERIDHPEINSYSHDNNIEKTRKTYEIQKAFAKKIHYIVSLATFALISGTLTLTKRVSTSDFFKPKNLSEGLASLTLSMSTAIISCIYGKLGAANYLMPVKKAPKP